MSTPERQQDADHEKLGGYGGTHVDPEGSEPVDPGLRPDELASDAGGVDYPAHPGVRDGAADEPAE